MSDREQILTAENLAKWLKALGAAEGSVNQDDIKFFDEPYKQSSRRFHDAEHRDKIGSGEFSEDFPELKNISKGQAEAIQAIAGQGHDLAYMHFDDGLHPAVDDQVSEYINISTDGEFTTSLTEKGKGDKVTSLVADLFDFKGEKLKLGSEGGNEFVSAVATAKWLESKQVPIQNIAAIVQNIAGTIPFKPANYSNEYPFEDGYMGALAERLRKTNKEYDLKVEETFIDEATLITVETANRDVENMWLNPKECIHGGLKLNYEMNKDLREDTHTAQQMMDSYNTWFYDSIIDGGPISAENIPHKYKKYPPSEIHNKRVETAREVNAPLARDYIKAKKVGVGLVAAMATFIGEKDVKLVDLVDGKKWSAVGVKNPKIDGDDMLLDALKSLGDGFDTPGYDIAESPISAHIYQATGKEGMKRLYDKLNNILDGKKEFCGREDARTYINNVVNEIGPLNLILIVEEQAKVAEEKNELQRENKIRELPLARYVSTLKALGLSKEANY